MKTTIIFTFLLLTEITLKSQTGINTRSPNPNTLLHIESQGNKGLKLPIVSLLQTTNISPLNAHVNGMIVFNTSTVNDVSPGMYSNNGSQWIKMTTNPVRIGDIKQGFQTTDHQGWYLLNGRTLASITSTTARANASALFSGTTIPDASDKFLKTANGSEVVGTTTGAHSIILTQANLPIFSFTGTTGTSGTHTHTYSDNVNTSTSRLAVIGTNNPIAGEEGNSAETKTTTTNGNHTHTVPIPSGGTNSPINIKPTHITVNTFIYLGQ